jgi:hypothetical protein
MGVRGQRHALAALLPVKTRYSLCRWLDINKITSNNFNVQRDSERTEIFKEIHISKIYYSMNGATWCRKLVQISRVKTWEKLGVAIKFGSN